MPVSLLKQLGRIEQLCGPDDTQFKHRSQGLQIRDVALQDPTTVWQEKLRPRRPGTLL